jgi:hypothetical protein
MDKMLKADTTDISGSRPRLDVLANRYIVDLAPGYPFPTL